MPTLHGEAHDCYDPGCIIAQRAGQSCALCRGCQVIRDAISAPPRPQFFATRSFTSERALEHRIADALGIQLTDARQVEAMAYAHRGAPIK